MRVSRPQEFSSDEELNKRQIEAYIIKRLKVKPMTEKIILNEVYSYYNDLVPLSVIIALKKRGLVIQNNIWTLKNMGAK